MNKNKLSYLKAMGIQYWSLKNKPNELIESHASVPPESELSIPEDKQFPSTWESLRYSVTTCTLCPIANERTQTVFGVGNPNAELMIIGEAPGFYEDKQGEPFVGRAGQLLNSMLEAIGFNRETVYIANILKCRPTNNRDPLPEEVANCTPFLNQQIMLVKPKLILAVGRIAAHYLLKTQTALGTLRGKIHQYAIYETPLIVTYHPAYLLRNPRDKAKAFQDLQLVSEYMLQ